MSAGPEALRDFAQGQAQQHGSAGFWYGGGAWLKPMSADICAQMWIDHGKDKEGGNVKPAYRHKFQTAGNVHESTQSGVECMLYW
ncbi:hypothetical protein AC578_5408 [Pseudocercospora eumusae]|uniref:Uncharacterized protein n=1 Tax=Pseudocercospora eumusae TaxID=321146 RepID=A0A139HK77_9PEZI|nr:hypothetical protein AC578_5408 [Pseudocercospora eumusae]